MKNLIALLCFGFLCVGRLCANDYSPLGMGEMVEYAQQIYIVKLEPKGDNLHLRIQEALKGSASEGVDMTSSISSYVSKDGVHRVASFCMDARVSLDEGVSSDLRIMFLMRDEQGVLRTFHPGCIQLIDKKDQILEILAMRRDPAPFVNSKKYADNLDLIHVLGEVFAAFHISVPSFPKMESYFAGHYGLNEYIPWQHMRFAMQFSSNPSNKPMLQMAPLTVSGALPDFFLQGLGWQLFEQYAESNKDQVPAKFEVKLDTTGLPKAGGLTFNNATVFLRSRLQSGKLETVRAAYLALAKLLDSDAVPAAMEMLSHQDRKYRREAAEFLSHARDPRSIDPLCAALDDLPPCIRYSAEGYNEDDNRLSGAIGKALLNLSNPLTMPSLKRAALKGYAGDWIAMTLSQLGDETAFEPLLSHLRNPDLNHYPGELVTMIQRSNLPVEAWMNKGVSSDDLQGNQDRAKQWISWWDANKSAFRIVRTWQEVRKLSVSQAK
jgi:hypothetical protein